MRNISKRTKDIKEMTNHHLVMEYRDSIMRYDGDVNGKILTRTLMLEKEILSRLRAIKKADKLANPVIPPDMSYMFDSLVTYEDLIKGDKNNEWTKRNITYI